MIRCRVFEIVRHRPSFTSVFNAPKLSAARQAMCSQGLLASKTLSRCKFAGTILGNERSYGWYNRQNMRRPTKK
jgi:hypothetical protein